jgi:nanoRNase/pAp phosphatase (c-di-AMP/oligoRNAs hydrolase)
MNRSGAGLVLQHINPDYPYKAAVLAVEDRDLWRFSLPDTKAICAYLSMHIHDLPALASALDSTSLDAMIDMGNVIVQYRNSLCRAITARRAFQYWEGAWVAVVECPPELVSEVGEALYSISGIEAVALWSSAANNQYRVSLRSPKTGADVNAIAQRFNGGGHAHAAGFYTPSLESVGLCK